MWGPGTAGKVVDSFRAAGVCGFKLKSQFAFQTNAIVSMDLLLQTELQNEDYATETSNQKGLPCPQILSA